MEALKRDYFALFGLTPAFGIDEAALEQAFRRLQSTMHPDRFVNAGAAEKRMAMQMATRVNEAWQVLAEPLRRARYLCEMNGIDVGAEDNTAMPAAFLMEQMSWHEALDELRESPDAEDYAAMKQRHEQAVAALHEQLRQTIDEDRDFAAAAGVVRQMMFLDRFGQQLKAAGLNVSKP